MTKAGHNIPSVVECQFYTFIFLKVRLSKPSDFKALSAALLHCSEGLRSVEYQTPKSFSAADLFKLIQVPIFVTVK